jgi:hypothetical protein
MTLKRTVSGTHAYSPGLKVKRAVKIRRVRRLPILGKVLVKEGDQVDFSSIIAETMIPGEPNIIKVSAELDILEMDINDYMKKMVGDKVNKGDIIAEYNAFFGLFKKHVYSPINGTIESISPISGQVIIREEPAPLSMNAYIPGRIEQLIENEGAIIETNAAFIQGIFGIGGETHGELRVATEDPNETLTSMFIEDDDEGKVIVGGSLVTKEAVDKALEVGVKGIITGGITDIILEEILGYELGVAITGQEEINLTLIITEGFGDIAMNPRTLEVFKEFEGNIACINGATQIRAGVIRPEVIIPHEKFVLEEVGDELSEGMTQGTSIRIIRQPYFGCLGRVVGLPVELQTVETESKVRVVEVELEDGRRVIVSRANIEIIEV